MIRYILVALGDPDGEIADATPEELAFTAEHITAKTGFTATILSEDNSRRLTGLILLEAVVEAGASA